MSLSDMSQQDADMRLFVIAQSLECKTDILFDGDEWFLFLIT